jgi:uncharacterized protein (TIGR00255 family)
MTGFGQSELERNGIKISVEVRSVNNRFLDVQIRTPRFLQPLEGRIREAVGSSISRGKISLVLSWEQAEESTPQISLDLNAARSYRQLLQQLKESLHLEDDVRLQHIMAFSEIFKQERQEWDLEQAWALVSEAVRLAIENLQDMRRQEGRQLFTDISQRIERLEEIVSQIQERYPERVQQIRAQLQDRITALLGRPEVDEQRLAMEIALMAEKADIAEECVRFRSHNKLFLTTLDEPGPVGRKLTFLLQEMNREANTMASKANDLQVAHEVVAIKEEIERIREQAQNIE